MSISISGPPETDLDAIRDFATREVEAFDAFFVSYGNQPLRDFETVIIRDYLLARFSGMFTPPSGPEATKKEGDAVSSLFEDLGK